MIGCIRPEHFAPDTWLGSGFLATSVLAGACLTPGVGLVGIGSFVAWKLFNLHVTRYQREGFLGYPPADFPALEWSGEEDILSEPPLKQLGMAVLLGTTQESNSVFWQPNNTTMTMNPNMGIIGDMGSGKTQFLKSFIWQLSRMAEANRAPIGQLVFDYKSDYTPEEFKQSVAATSHKLYKLPYNPLALFGEMPRLPVHAASAFTDTVARAFGLGEKQRLRLQETIEDAYELAGIFPDKPTTWKRTAPTVRDVWDIFTAEEQERDSLYAALHKLISFQIFEENQDNLASLHEMIERDGVSIIDLAGYDPGIQNLVVGLTLDQFYAQMQRRGKPEVDGDFRQITKLVIVDEADNFMSEDFSSLKKILKEGREYGVGTILSTQQITHFRTGEDNYARYMKSWIVHQVDEISPKDIRAIFNVTDKAQQDDLMESVRHLGKHQSYSVASDKTVTQIKDRAYWEWMKS